MATTLGPADQNLAGKANPDVRGQPVAVRPNSIVKNRRQTSKPQ